MTTTNKFLLMTLCILFGDLFIGTVKSHPVLPSVTPTFCSKSFCFFVKGPYAINRIVSYYEKNRDGGAVVFQDGTLVSFGSALTSKNCDSFSNKWVAHGANASLTYLCFPEQKRGNLLLVVKIRGGNPLIVDRYQGESEICAWNFSVNKVVNKEGQFLPISGETCVGNRMGYALP